MIAPRQEGDALIAALTAVIRHADAAERISSDPRAFLDSLGLAGPDVEALLSFGPQRLMAYRSLVHNRVRNVVFNFLPRTKAALGEGVLRKHVVEFIARRGIASPYLRDVPREFVDFAAPRWAPDVAALARYELLEEDLPNDPRPVGEATDIPVALDRGVRCNGTARILSFDHEVRAQASQGADDPVPALDTPLRLLVCRDRKHAYRELELSALGAALFEALRSGATLQAAVLSAASDTGETVDDPLLERATYELAKMLDVDALLGAEVTASDEEAP